LEPSPPPAWRVHVHVGLDHLVIKVVAFAGALTDAGQNRVTAVGLGDVVDQFLHGDGLADAGAAEQADLAALGVGAEQVDDLDAGDEDFRRGRLLGEGGRLAVDRAVMVVLIGPASSIGSPMTFMMRPSVPGPTGTMIEEPVSTTGWPRVRPSVVSMAMVRTVFSPRCWATSRTRRKGSPVFWSTLVVSSAFRMAGRCPLELDVDDGADDLHDAAGGAAGFFGAAVSVIGSVAFGKSGSVGGRIRGLRRRR
jgi:hypothetical protein